MSPPSIDSDDSFQPRFGGWFAKVEVFLGLFAASGGLLLSHWAMGATGQFDPLMMGFSFGLIVLGGYLALAGQRSHMYRSVMESEKSLRILLQRLHKKG